MIISSDFCSFLQSNKRKKFFGSWSNCRLAYLHESKYASLLSNRKSKQEPTTERRKGLPRDLAILIVVTFPTSLGAKPYYFHDEK
mmetsp:Transcript_13704/g.23336  ORF Transcript_13704/g.23336 Transcript_13704/m.23336 type:complete len:85 (+) Transcript_13704:41-295(+)